MIWRVQDDPIDLLQKRPLPLGTLGKRAGLASRVIPASLDALDSRLTSAANWSQCSGSLPFGPEHTADHLVADLHHVGKHAGLAKCPDCRARIVEDHRADKLVVRHGLPCRGDELLAGICPSVGVMKVEEELEAQPPRLAWPGQSCIRDCSAGAAGCGKTQPNPVVTMVLEDLQPRPGLARILERDSAILGLLEERQVGADGVSAAETGPASRARIARIVGRKWLRIERLPAWHESCLRIGEG